MVFNLIVALKLNGRTVVNWFFRNRCGSELENVPYVQVPWNCLSNIVPVCPLLPFAHTFIVGYTNILKIIHRPISDSVLRTIPVSCWVSGKQGFVPFESVWIALPFHVCTITSFSTILIFSIFPQWKFIPLAPSRSTLYFFCPITFFLTGHNIKTTDNCRLRFCGMIWLRLYSPSTDCKSVKTATSLSVIFSFASLHSLLKYAWHVFVCVCVWSVFCVETFKWSFSIFTLVVYSRGSAVPSVGTDKVEQLLLVMLVHMCNFYFVIIYSLHSLAKQKRSVSAS